MIKTFRVSVFLTKRSILHGSRGIFLVSSLIIALLFINLLFIPSLLKGASDGLKDQTTNILTSDIIMSPASGGGYFNDYGQVLDKVSDVSGVKAATAVNLVGNRVSLGSHSVRTSVIAIDPTSYNQVFSNHIAQGSLLNQTSTGALVGATLTGANLTNDEQFDNSLKGGQPGDTISLTMVDGSSHPYKIIGIFDNHIRQADNRVFVAFDSLSSFSPVDTTRATTIYIKANPKTDLTALQANLRGRFPNYQFQLGVSSIGIDEQVKTISLINAILGIISLVVAAATVFIVTFVDLSNRRRLIGIERAIGISTAAIQLSYVLRTIVVATLGMAFGTILYLSLIIPVSKRHPFSFPNGPVSLAYQKRALLQFGCLLMISALIATVIPSWYNLRAKLVDVIWGNK